MSFMNPSDMVEEDAADLQFPKEEINKPESSISQYEKNQTPSSLIPEDMIIIKPNKLTKHTIEYYDEKKLLYDQQRKRHYSQGSPIKSVQLLKIDKEMKCEKCATCRANLTEPFIKCMECVNTFLCLKCFSEGKETSYYHRNTHSYTIMHDNVQVFPQSLSSTSTEIWTGLEEKLLLDCIASCGYGNWDDISRKLSSISKTPRTPEECRDHYCSCYFDGIFKKILGLTNEYYFPERIPYLYKIKSIDPPRLDFESINFKNMAGYRCARGDFDIPYDNSAESVVSNLDLLTEWPDEMKTIADDLHCAVFNAYNHRLEERRRRYEIMRNHGLLDTSKTLRWLSKYSEALTPITDKTKYGTTGRFIAFMQLMNPSKFDCLVESMQYFLDMKKYLLRLYESRSNGLTTFHGERIYQRLKQKRLSKERMKQTELHERLYDWRNLIPKENQLLATINGGNPFLNSNLYTLTQPRRKCAPLQIIGLPGYDKLSEGERKLCSVARVVPLDYLEFKNILIAENSKLGYLRLGDARRMIKIDVNKTRQIYDFLIEHGFINKKSL